MRNTIALLAVCLFAALASACTYAPPTVITGSGKVISEPREVSGYSAVELSGVGSLLIAQNIRASKAMSRRLRALA